MTADTSFPPTVENQTSLPAKKRVYQPSGPRQVPAKLADPEAAAPPKRTIRAVGGTSPVIPLLMIGTGAYLAWFAVRYWRGTGPAVWPSYPVKAILQGKGLPAPAPAATAAAEVAAYEQAAPQPGTRPVPAGGQPQNTARLLLPRYGWQADQMPPLVKLWQGESGWNPRARNPNSGALGIAQALGHGGPDTAGTLGNEYGAEFGLTTAEAKAANSGSALQQIRWGLGYIRDRYGSPKAAYTAWSARSPHWY